MFDRRYAQKMAIELWHVNSLGEFDPLNNTDAKDQLNCHINRGESIFVSGMGLSLSNFAISQITYVKDTVFG